VLRVSDPVLLASAADIVLFAVRSAETRQSQVAEALRRLPDRCKSRILMVLTRARRKRFDRVGYYGGYAQRHAHDAPR
jgi:hypothetical protein